MHRISYVDLGYVTNPVETTFKNFFSVIIGFSTDFKTFIEWSVVKKFTEQQRRGLVCIVEY